MRVVMTSLLIGAALLACQQAAEAKKKAGQAYKEVTVTWHPADATITQYKLYVARDTEDVGVFVRSVKDGADGFDAKNPKVVLDTKSDVTLEELKGGQACFAVAALDSSGTESDRTAAQCVGL
jgi:hypothetical protein